MEKPTRKADLEPQFTRIGEPGWAERVKALLTAYSVPLPTPVPEGALARREVELGVTLPTALRAFLIEIGPLDLDLRIHRPEEIVFCDQIWFRDNLTPEHQALLPQLLAVADHLGTGDVIAMPPGSGCCLLGHDPPGLWKPLPDFDTLIKVMLMRLPTGYYGWPDEELAKLVDEAVTELVGYCY